MACEDACMTNVRVVRSGNYNSALNVTFRSGGRPSSSPVPLDDDQTFFDLFFTEEFNFCFRARRCQHAHKTGRWQQKRQQQKREGNPVASFGC